MGNTKVIRSGDVRYDRDNEEVKLVRAFVSEVPEKNLWAVMYADKKMGVVDLGQATNFGKRFFTKKPKKGKPLFKGPELSQAEWLAMQEEAVALAGLAPKEDEVVGTDSVAEAPDDASESDGEGMAEPSAPPPRETYSAPPPPLTERAPAVRSATPAEPSVLSEDSVVRDFISLLQMPSLRACGALLVALTGILLAVPNGTDVFVTGGELVVTGGELFVQSVKALGWAVKFLKTMPAYGWGILLFVSAVVWLIDELVGWRSLLQSLAGGHKRSGSGARDVSPRRPSAIPEASGRDLRAADFELRVKREALDPAEALRDRQCEPSYMPLPRDSRGRFEARKDSEADRGRQEDLAAVLSALDTITSRLNSVENRQSEAPPKALSGPGAGALGDDFPDTGFMSALKERASAFDAIVQEDRGLGGKVSEPPRETLRDGRAEQWADLRATQQRVMVFSQDPLKILERFPPREVDFGVVKSRIAPSYAFHIYHKDKKASSYFHNLLASKGLAGAGAGVVPLAHEVERLASCLDEMLYVDGVDIINSLHAERMLRRLYGVEYTLSGVASRDDLKSADWTTADKLDLNKLENGGGFHNETVMEEARKRMEREAQHSKWEVKSREAQELREKALKKKKPE